MIKVNEQDIINKTKEIEEIKNIQKHILNRDNYLHIPIERLYGKNIRNNIIKMINDTLKQCQSELKEIIENYEV